VKFDNLPWKAIGSVVAAVIVSAVGTQQYVSNTAPATAKVAAPKPCACNCIVPKIEIPPTQVFVNGKEACEVKVKP
jgi:hypothetical protein